MAMYDNCCAFNPVRFDSDRKYRESMLLEFNEEMRKVRRLTSKDVDEIKRDVVNTIDRMFKPNNMGIYQTRVFLG